MPDTQLQAARYVSLATFRQSGAMVATPVWAAFDQDCFFVFSAGEAGKVKRLRNSDHARLATCDARGGSLGPWHDARAHIITDSQMVHRALAALRVKYGWQMWLADTGARLSGRFARRAYLQVTLET